MYPHVHSVLPAQAIVITDPLLARYVLRSKLLDKFRFLYSFLDPVRNPSGPCTAQTLAP